MNEQPRKELVVSAIENGTVIDHIPSANVFQVMKILGLDKTENQVLFGTNLESRKYGFKGIIKVRNQFFEDREINKISLVAPNATLIVIRDFNIVEKRHVQVPDKIESMVKCFNPKCITNYEAIPTRFKVVDKEDLKLLCHYCEKITKKENVQFI